MKKILRQISTSGLAAIISIAIAQGAAAQTLSQSPLEATVIVEPNFMLNLDDSLSMNNITTDTGYNSTEIYDAWTINFAAGTTTSFYYPNNIPHEFFQQGGCSAGYIEATFAGSTRCIDIPDPNTGTGLDDTLYTENYVRYLFENFSIANTEVDLNGVIPGETRIDVLKTAATTLVNSLDNIRWCVSDLQNAGTDTVPNSACGSDPLSAIQNITLDGGGTPLAETMFEIVEYFQRPHATGGPVQYRCQKNYALIITDGYPTNDESNSTAITGTSRSDYGLGPRTEPHPNDPDLPLITVPATQSLPNWDGYSTTTTSDDFFNSAIPVGSDGVTTIAASNEGGTLFLDDMALFANEIDLFRSGTDLAGEPFHDATTSDDRFAHQNIVTYTIGFGLQNQMLGDAAAYGEGLNRSASNAESLNEALSAIGIDANPQNGSSASSTATTAFLSGGNQVFQVKYSTSNWGGSLISREINSDPTSQDFGQLAPNALWNTDDTFVGSNETSGGVVPDRNILTINDDTDSAVTFDWLNLSESQRLQLGSEDVLNYLRGDQSQEATNGGGFRDRDFLLGDVVHSQPVFVGAQDFGYSDPSYTTFLESSVVQGRDTVVYVGSNDGALHGFSAETDGSGGSEVFAFVPRSVYPYLQAYSDVNYDHHYSVDGRSTLLDAQLQDGTTQNWATVLISSMGAGGTGIFALDVTDPRRFSNLDVDGDDIFLWEISNSFPLEVTGTAASNIALSGTATQSTVAYSGVPERAIDGNRDAIYNNDSITHTNNELNPHWDLELSALSELEEVRLFNRQDCCSDRLSDFSVFVSTEPFASENLAATRAQAGVTEFPFAGEADPQENIDLSGIEGRYLRVQLHGTNPLSLAEVEVIGRELQPVYPDLGSSLDRPSIVRVNTDNNGEVDWYALSGNGVHSNNEHAVFYVVDLTTGAKVQELVLDDSFNNGIISNTAVDVDGDDSVDRVYLTDIKGNIWRLNWELQNGSGSFVSEYTDAGGDPIPMFTATATSDNTRQVVSAAVEVTRLPGESGTLLLHFGSGKYYDIEDSEVEVGDQRQSFYGLVDRGAPTTGTYTTLTKSSLERVTIATQSLSGSNGGQVRVVDGDPVDYQTQSGWFIDLPTDGERVVYDPTAIKDRILFTTLIPEDTGVLDPCLPLVTGWLMEVDAVYGVSPDSITFDANGDGSFNASDVTAATNSAGENLQVAGIKPTAGAPLPPSVIRVDAGGNSQGLLKGIVIDSAANVEEFVHLTPISRTSWRRLN